MARVTNGMITYDDANYMIANNGFTRIGSVITGLNCLNKSEIITYMNLQQSYFSSYASNQLVPYNLLVATIVADTIAPTAPVLNSVIGSQTLNQIVVSWSASTDNLGHPILYMVYRNTNGGAYSYLTGGDFLTYTDTSVAITSNITYGYKIISFEQPEQNVSADSNIITLYYTDTTAPSTPTSLSTSLVTSSSMTLSWGASTDNVAVTGYKIYNYGSYVKTVGVVTSSSMTGLSTSTSYSWTVRAIDAKPNESGIPTAKVTSTSASVDSVAPSTVLNLAVGTITASTIALSWDIATDNVDVTNYQLYNTGGTFILDMGNVTNYTVTGLAASTAYSYKIKAEDAAGNISAAFSNTVTPSTIAAVDSTAPSNVAILYEITTAATTTQNLTWTAATDNVGIGGYAIYSGAGTFIRNASGTGLSTVMTGLSPGTQYTYKIKAYDTAASANYSVAFSNTVTKYTVSNATTLSAGTATTTTQPLTWTSQVGASSYTLWWKITGGTYASITGLTGTSYTKTGLASNTSYTYYIQVVNPDWISAGSNTLTQSTAAAVDTTPPSQVTGVGISSITSSTATITWNASTDNVTVTGYQVILNYDPEIGGGIYYNTTNLSLPLTGLDPSTYYSVTVFAYDAAGNYSTATWSDFTTAAAGDTEAPSAPYVNGTDISGATRILVYWDASTDNVGVTGYAVYKSTDEINYTLGNTTTGLSLAVTVNTAQLTYFKVKAYDAAGNYSAYSNIVVGCNDNGNPCF